MKKIYFVRHGESQANVDNVVAGSEYETPLTDRGREQARQAGKLLKDKKIELVICSPLERTRDTAAIIVEEIGYDPDKIRIDSNFIERKAGPYDGTPHKQYHEDIRSGNLKPGGETTEELFNRTKKAVESLRDLPEQVILVVSHGGTGRMIRALKNNTDYDEVYLLPGMKNAEIEEFTLD